MAGLSRSQKGAEGGFKAGPPIPFAPPKAVSFPGVPAPSSGTFGGGGGGGGGFGRSGRGRGGRGGRAASPSIITQAMLQSYYNQQRKNMQDAFNNQIAQLNLKILSSKQGEAIKERGLNSKYTASGANTALGHTQGLGDLRTQLANTLQGIEGQRVADYLRLIQQVQTQAMTAGKAGIVPTM